MPGFNQSGPTGQGPMTGWGQGVCKSGGEAQTAGKGRGAGGRCRRIGFGNDNTQGQFQGLRRRAMHQAVVSEPTTVPLADYMALKADYKKVQETLAALELKLAASGDEPNK